MQPSKYFNNVVHAFYFPEIGGMHNNFFVVGRYHFAKRINWLFAKPANINKIVNYFYLFINNKGTVGFFAQVLRYRSNSITFIDGKCNNRLICFIFPNQSNIGTVQGSNNRNISAAFSAQFALP